LQKKGGRLTLKKDTEKIHGKIRKGFNTSPKEEELGWGIMLGFWETLDLFMNGKGGKGPGRRH